MQPFLKNSLDTLVTLSERTPDFAELNKKSSQLLIFVYDDCMVGKSQYNKTLSQAIYHGKAKTTSMRFNMRIPDGQRSPLAFFDDVGDEKTSTGDLMGSIEGELFSVSLRHLTYLDHWFDNCEAMKRVEKFVRCGYGKNTNQTKEVFMYVGNKEWWDTVEDFRTMTIAKNMIVNGQKTYMHY